MTVASPGVRRALACALKDICYVAWSTEPQRAIGAAGSLKALSETSQCPEIAALAAWVAGIAAPTDGQMERAIERLDEEARFLALDQSHNAASTQVSKAYALAMLGRYEATIGTGLRAREVFLTHDDALAAGRIEHNIGNICWRHDRFQEDEH